MIRPSDLPGPEGQSVPEVDEAYWDFLIRSKWNGHRSVAPIDPGNVLTGYESLNFCLAVAAVYGSHWSVTCDPHCTSLTFTPKGA